jgi:hypothetical protein
MRILESGMQSAGCEIPTYSVGSNIVWGPHDGTSDFLLGTARESLHTKRLGFLLIRISNSAPRIPIRIPHFP